MPNTPASPVTSCAANAALTVGPIAIATGERTTTNDDLAARFGTTPEVILRKIGIQSRPLAPVDLPPKELALQAARQLFESPDFDAARLGLIITSSSTVGQVCPPVSCEILAEITRRHPQAPHPMAFDIMATCTGWLYALSIATDHLHQPGNRDKFALISTTEMFSLGFADDDFAVWASFGDVATATAVYGPGYDISTIPALHKTQAPDGAMIDITGLPPQLLHITRPLNFAKPDTTGALWGPPAYTSYKLRMDGRELRNQSMPAMLHGLNAALAASEFTPADIDILLAHQSNQRVLVDVANELNLDPRQVPTNLLYRGNTSSSALPLLIHDMRIGQTTIPGQAGKLETGFPPGATIALTAFGGGYTYGAATGQVI